MKLPSTEQIGDLISAFELQGQASKVEPLGNGHIHHSWLLTLDDTERYVLQQINTNVFRDLPSMMQNMHRVTAHINSRRHGRSRWQSLRPQITTGGTITHLCPEDTFWRCCAYVSDTSCFEHVTERETAYQVGRGYGMFLADLSDLPLPKLHETLPRFHDTPWRFECLIEAIDRDPEGRVESARKEIAFAMDRHAQAGRLLELQRSGAIPERTTHNDTKVNNILLDANTQEPVCVIDLDTVMPGLSLYDFGDLVRSAGGTVAEDHPQADEMSIRTDIYTALAQGYIHGSEDTLSATEIDLMPFAASLITLEIGVRFLTDYLSGDTYFKTTRPQHNLDRCRTQFALTASISEQEDDLKSVL